MALNTDTLYFERLNQQKNDICATIADFATLKAKWLGKYDCHFDVLPLKFVFSPVGGSKALHLQL